MPRNDWVDIDTIKVISRHASGVLPAALVFKGIGLIIEWGFKSGTLKTILIGVDNFCLVGIFIWLAIQMGILLWNRREKIQNGPASCFMVA